MSLHLFSDADNATLLYVLERCPNLTRLELIGGDFTDQALSQVSRCCPKIVWLDLFGMDNITDQGMVDMLDGFANSPFKFLAIAECENITDTTLIKIAEMIPDVCELTVWFDGSPELVLELISSRRLRCKIIDCINSPGWIKRQLQIRGFTPMPFFRR